jgi:hypothetical protein
MTAEAYEFERTEPPGLAKALHPSELSALPQAARDHAAKLDTMLDDLDTIVRSHEKVSAAIQNEPALFDRAERQVVHVARFVEYARFSLDDFRKQHPLRAARALAPQHRAVFLARRNRIDSLRRRSLRAGTEALGHLRKLFVAAGRVNDFDALAAAGEWAAEPDHDRMLRNLAQR